MNSSAENPFWQWSLERYSRKPVERGLLKLQDECGFDINVSLWCCWRAESGANVDDHALEAAIEAKREWTANVVHPLRATRRYLKSVDSGADQDVTRLRERIKAAELDAEKHVQNLLFRSDLAAPTGTPENPAKTALKYLNLYAKLLDAAKNPAFSEHLLQELVDNIFKRAQNLTDERDGARKSNPAGDRR